MGCTREDGDSVVRVWITRAVQIGGIEIVHHRIRDYHVDSAELVDQLDEAVQAYPHVVVDVNFEVGFYGVDGSLRSCELVGGADLAHARVGYRHPEIPRDRQHGRLLRARVDSHENHRL